MSPSFKCLIVDAFPIVRSRLRDTLETLPSVEQVTEAGKIEQALDILKRQSVDLLTLDIKIGNSNGFELLRRARAHGFAGKVLFISSEDYSTYSQLAKESSANGYISKSEEESLIKDAIQSILKGYSLFKLDSHIAHSKQMPLSEREQVVFDYLVQGYSNKQISELLSLSAKTISTYKSRILDKHNASSIIELMNYQSHKPSVPSQYTQIAL
ncbi:response regulator [Vibrio astriarenae]|uniref:response regulator n=1 Tax=Vibrio astriarenae TaxID=1481923 RepID=UPI003736738F